VRTGRGGEKECLSVSRPSIAPARQAGNAAEAAAAEITGYNTYADLLEALDTRRKQS
jgi:hypothetical protein